MAHVDDNSAELMRRPSPADTPQRTGGMVVDKRGQEFLVHLMEDIAERLLVDVTLCEVAAIAAAQGADEGVAVLLCDLPILMAVAINPGRLQAPAL